MHKESLEGRNKPRFHSHPSILKDGDASDRYLGLSNALLFKPPLRILFYYEASLISIPPNERK